MRRPRCQQAVSDAAQYSAKSEAWLASNPSGGGTYSTWFGAYNSSRFNHVTSVYSHITNELTTKTLLLDCTSDERLLRVRLPERPLHHLSLLWFTGERRPRGPTRRPERSSTSRATSPSTAAPDDHVYGQNGAKQLARSNPAYAVTNADNFEYFAESQ